MRTRTTATLVAAVVIVAGAGAGVGYALSQSGGGISAIQPLPGSSVLPTVTSSRVAVLPSPSPSASAASPSAVAARIRGAIANPGLGSGFAATVEDAATGSMLYDRNATRGEPPASTTKLLTATAALATLGPQARLSTRTVRLGHIVYLVGGGDVTLTATPQPSTYPEPAALSTLAHETASALSNVGQVKVRLDTSAWSGPATAVGWHSDYVAEGDITPPSALELDEGRLVPGLEVSARVRDPAMQAGQAFVALLRRDGVHVHGRPALATAPPAATSLAAVSSPTVDQLVQRMLTNSDNDLAEALGREVALHDHLPGSYVGAAAAVTQRVAALGIATAGLRLHDTSGLSPADRIPPADLVATLRLDASAAHPGLRSVLAGLPIAGFTGTLGPRYRTSPTRIGAGVIRAKTGTLNGVSTLAGVLLDRSGRLLAFALMAPHVPATGSAEQALDDVAARLVGCGCG